MNQRDRPLRRAAILFAVESRCPYPEAEGCKLMPLSDDQLRALGWITLLFNELDWFAHSIASALVNSDPNIGRVAFEGESLYNILDKAKKLSRAVFQPGTERCIQIDKWADRADRVRKRRNDVLHALWAVDQPTGEMV